ncbi:TetR family transcriptional regulator [Mycolicibacterium conceptionense]|uniref:TetR family transcriptional regulator n=1 Tax=Mycolicibacterium conceptionense TaxID=451644 RepID=A0A1A0PU77_9MYCO|nr:MULTISPECIES: TetR family transcriptional regulator [Mycolicibacterium]MCW1825072.1 TetR/AcrR family transcriptional regulator [Mycolicibacterium senegalense]OBB13327.1 TetR family transcriptional regulator [Mycolicibacterium conceptionense]OBE92721.1 TetR family transcriptional regulator [Mycolicibacterium conceptionense]OBF12086.1 TetR family transcriptional regulator [Mycolicibacterium conceptionense]OBF43202.1 TetR family transcriptional regulator [Mycolicibacterium conceptionense]
MARWEPNARGRLEEAALDLFGEQGFERTAVAEIAARAGLTERTYFRHFADKREVLFWGEHLLRDTLVAAIADAPESSALEMVRAGLGAVTAIFAERRDHARRRQAVIDANPGLQERELAKLAGLATATAEVLRSRGVAEPAASLAAQAGIAVFKVAFGQWISAADGADLADLIDAAFAELKAITAI